MRDADACQERKVVQEQLLLADRKTILMPLPSKQEPTPEEQAEYESPFQRVKRIMREVRDE